MYCCISHRSFTLLSHSAQNRGELTLLFNLFYVLDLRSKLLLSPVPKLSVMSVNTVLSNYSDTQGDQFSILLQAGWKHLS